MYLQQSVPHFVVLVHPLSSIYQLQWDLEVLGIVP